MLHEEIIINNRAKLYSYCLDNSSELGVKSRPTVFICPGGGYAFCSKREGEQVAIAFNNHGFNAFLIEYTTKQGFSEAYKDGVEAFKYVYNNKEKYAINKLLVCGFSAGAHLACSIANTLDIKPDGEILIYPLLIQAEWQMCPDAIDLLDKITEKTPKTFIVHASDDPIVPVHNTYRLMEQLDLHHVEFESHVFRVGGHGFSLATRSLGAGNPSYDNSALAIWFDLCISWIKNGIGDIEFLPNDKLTVDELPDNLKVSFSKLYANEKIKAVLDKIIPDVVKNTVGGPYQDMPLANIIIYSTKMNLDEIRLLSDSIKNI